MKSLSIKRSATGGILLEIREENKNQIAEKITSALRSTLGKYKGVRVQTKTNGGDELDWHG